MANVKAYFSTALFLSTLLLLVSCGNKEPVTETAENALDGSREFSRAILAGDFTRAKKFCVPNPANDSLMGIIKVMFFDPLSESERKQMKVVSLNIAEVVEYSADTTIVTLSNNNDKKQKKIQVVRQNNYWLVNLPYYCNNNKF